MPDRSIIQAVRRAFAACGARLRDMAIGASGLAAYDQYLAHLRAQHSDRVPMSREAFFRSDQAARWEGARRCC